jgi:YjbE family integral membrane protein
MLEFLFTAQGWVALLQIIGVNIVLSGDNAIVIALACRSLPEQQRRLGVLFGSLGAITLRIILTFFAVYLLQLPYLKIIGALLLFWIGVRLIAPDEDGEGHASDHDNLAAAIKTIIVADLVMSLDNVLGVAAAAKGNVPLIIIGLLISIPLIIFGSTLIMKLMDRFPVLVTLGGGLLGYVAGEMAVSDPSLEHWLTSVAYIHYGLPWLCALLVVIVGKWLMARRFAPALIDLAEQHAPLKKVHGQTEQR